MFDKVLIANRGEIAARIIRTLRKMGVSSVAVYSDADKFSAPVLDADHAVHIGAAPPCNSYLNVDAIVEACRSSGAQAVHPGYGFLSENAEFAEKLESQGIRFIGPRPEHLRKFGLKHTARELARHSKLQLLPGSELLDNVDTALSEAERIGYPVMLKSTAGGGGIGMHLCCKPDDLVANFATVQRMATASFGDARVYMEHYVETARHVEVQIFGDGKGSVITLGERDCSLQRRNQKMVEETPAPGLSDAMRQRLHAAARALGQAVSYESAGTVEFIYDVAREDFYFLEVNTRLQVEHPVTESVFDIDLVEWMIRQAAGEMQLPEQKSLKASGAAVEVRLYAENPLHGFQPSTGLLTEVNFPASIRVDSWIETGTEVTPYYDPMLAKLIAVGDTRSQAIKKLTEALAKSSVCGIETNLEYLQAVLSDNAFLSGAVATQLLKNFHYQPSVIEVLTPGAQSSIQDDPGRLGYWDVGIPPSGPMDMLNFRLANKAVGNAPGTAALECTMIGPTLRFVHETLIALTGATMQATIDGIAQPYYEPIMVQAGQTLRLGKIEGYGQRTYLAVRGGIKAPLYLGSRACFALGGFGGHSTSLLRVGDTLHVDDQLMVSTPKVIDHGERPALTSDWSLSVLYGPQGAPDFFTPHDIDTLFSSEYEVFYNSDRTGIRLIGPRPQWARIDGGEAGLHPSNIHDNAYAIGAINFAGDMPIILGPDGPSLGGYVCPAVITRQDMWKLGQLKPGDKLRFVAAVDPQQPLSQQDDERGALIVAERRDGPVDVVYRRSGDDYLLIEYGPMVLDLVLRLRVHLLMQAVRDANLPAIIDLTPGIRSLQIHYDSTQLGRMQLLNVLQDIEAKLPLGEEVTVPSRIVHLPMAFNDSTIQLATRKYQNLVRPNAPWCPDNIEFIRRINGLESREDVKRIVFDASYLVLGLGDVYLDAPAATPIDPRHRLVTTKYNPARTWTPENAVGIGGSYMCIYGMESPGGYQLIGRTVQIWNRWKKTAEFDQPYLLHFFDQVRFFPVSEQELDEARQGFLHGCYPLKIEHTQLSFSEYSAFLKREASSIAEFKQRQQAAFDAERADWKERGLDSYVVDQIAACNEDEQLPEGCVAISSHVTGRVWKILVQVGDTVKPDQAVLVLESMKMEIEINAPQSGCVSELRCIEGQTVQSGQTLAILEEATTSILPKLLNISILQALYTSGSLTPLTMMQQLIARITAYPDAAVWISRFNDATLLEAARALGNNPSKDQPLWGIPFAVKDNIDVAELDTTAACPAFAYRPSIDAPVVAKLRAAGALVIGKTNLDQFATGLNGTRSPYGAPRCVYNSDYISGGSSSGSAVAVAAGLVSFALGSDTAGSGRVPAGFNNIVGLKPTRGWLSSTGLVPACRSLDCVSVLALDVDDAEQVTLIAAGFDPSDAYSRQPPAMPTCLKRFRFGVPASPEWYGDAQAEHAYKIAIGQLEAIGAQLVPMDFTDLFEIANLLYFGPWVAERTAATEEFLHQHANDMDATVRGIIEKGLHCSAVDAFRGEYRRRALQRKADQLMAGVDALLVPTAPRHYKISEMLADPLVLNSHLGHYTNFVNLLNWSALSLPAGFREDGLPFGITVIGPTWYDHALVDFGRRWMRREALPSPMTTKSPLCMLHLAVVGMHLRGMPLNGELTDLGAKFVEVSQTSPNYHLYALHTNPPKPGLIRKNDGSKIEVELWDLPLETVGQFLLGVHSPLGLGTLELDDGRNVTGFICEPYALGDAEDITQYGGWRAYIASK